MKEDNLPSLLLLPLPPHPANRRALSAAYRPSLKAAISKLKDEPQGAVLIIALALPVLQGQFRRQKALSWSELQSLLAGIYSLISVVSAELSVGTDVNGGPGTVDSRVVLVDHDREKRLQADFTPAIELNNTVIPDFATFVSAYHPWKYIFHVNNEPGYQLLSTYLKMYEGIQLLRQDQIIVLEGGLSLSELSEASRPSTQTKLSQVVCLGGTFDHLHPGHKLLLTAMALLLNVPVEEKDKQCTCIIGITGDEMLKNKKYAEYVQSWDDRALNVIEFLSSILYISLGGWKGGAGPKISKADGEMIAYFRDDTIVVKCLIMQDLYGPTITVRDMDVLVVSGETRSGGAAVVEKRKELGWGSLDVFEVDVLDAKEIGDTEPAEAQSFESKISSTEIRKQKAESKSRI